MEELRITVSYGGEDPGDFSKLKADIDRLGIDPETGNTLVDLASVWDDKTAPWEVTVTWAVEADTATPIAVDLRARNGQPVTPEAWRAVKVAAVIRETRARLGWQHERVAGILAGQGDTEAAVKAQRGSDALSERPRPGRRSIYDAAHYARVADLYKTAVQAGDTRPVRAVANQLAATLDDPQLTKDNRVKAWVREARKRGFIHGERYNGDG